MHISTGTYRRQKRALDPLDWELQGDVSCLMWVLGTKLGFEQK